MDRGTPDCTRGGGGGGEGVHVNGPLVFNKSGKLLTYKFYFNELFFQELCLVRRVNPSVWQILR